MARDWHRKHISTQWGVAILGFLLVSTLLLIPYLGHIQDLRSQAAVGDQTYAKGNGNGLSAIYYSRTDFSGRSYPRLDREINFIWPYNAQFFPYSALSETNITNMTKSNEDFSVVWSGKVLPPYTGIYTFGISSDDGSQLSVNGKQLFSNYVVCSSCYKNGTVNLTRDVAVPIEIRLKNFGGNSKIQLNWIVKDAKGRTLIFKQGVPGPQLYSK